MSEILKLRSVISEESRSHFQRHEAEIRRILSLEIIGRVKGEKERIKVALKNDPQVEVAVSLVRGKRAYQQILSGTPR